MSGVSSSADVFRAIADPTRRQLLDLLAKRERSFSDLAGSFKVSQPAIAQHLGILKKARLVRCRRSGRQSFYKVNPKPLEKVYAWSEGYKRLSDPSGHVWSISPINRVTRTAQSGQQITGAQSSGGSDFSGAKFKRDTSKEGSMITGAKSITVCVSDQNKAAEFFTQKLGFEVRRDEPMGPQARWIEMAPKGAQTVLIPFTPPGMESRIGAFSGIVFGCDDAQATYQQLSSRGVEFTGPPQKQPWGGLMTQFKDFDGNEYVLVQD